MYANDDSGIRNVLNTKENMCRQVGGCDFCQKTRKEGIALEYLASKVNTNKGIEDFLTFCYRLSRGDDKHPDFLRKQM